jgi:hypothetical protein
VTGCGLRCAVYGLRYAVCGVWSTEYGPRLTACGLKLLSSPAPILCLSLNLNLAAKPPRMSRSFPKWGACPWFPPNSYCVTVLSWRLILRVASELEGRSRSALDVYSRFGLYVRVALNPGNNKILAIEQNRVRVHRVEWKSQCVGARRERLEFKAEAGRVTRGG